MASEHPITEISAKCVSNSRVRITANLDGHAEITIELRRDGAQVIAESAKWHNGQGFASTVHVSRVPRNVMRVSKNLARDLLA